ncbi:MAG: hypothetical protein HKM04_11780, partial [Legionellales bacterium]|nr:hypothetical protein [Legionellales bacterium]
MESVKDKFTNQLQKQINEFLDHECFQLNTLNPATPYIRPIRKQDFASLDLSKPITSFEITSNKNLLLNKLLLTIYEQDMLFLNKSFNELKTKKTFKSFYDSEFVAKGKVIKPFLENRVFQFLDNEIEIIGHWNKDKLISYFAETIDKQEKLKNELCLTINKTSNKELACKMLLVQMAPDFLSEASAMARTLSGSFCEEQSELMKIFIDEYGYGVHNTKHSTLFENTLNSIGMNTDIHFYYDAYLPTSLMLVNYFHYVCSNKDMWFQYLGALYYTEASIPHFNKQISILLKQILPSINTAYFDEHVHIDQHHRRMINKLIISSIDKYGDEIINEILKGFESFRFLQSIAELDLIEQIEFMEMSNKKQTNTVYERKGEKIFFTEEKNELTLSHIHDESELFTVTEGSLHFHHNGIESTLLPVCRHFLLNLLGLRVRQKEQKIGDKYRLRRAL